jgi:hypothetical protein
MKPLSPPILNLRALVVLAAVLLLPLAASAQTGTPSARTIASDLCDFASNTPADLAEEIDDLMQDAGFIGLPPDECDKFVKSLVKSCLALVRTGTACSVNVNAAVGLNAGSMSEIGCDTQPDKASQKSCRSTVRANTQSNAAVSSQPVQLQGTRACNEDFAAAMLDLCLDGEIAP